MNIEKIQQSVKVIQDFPKADISFLDISSVLIDPQIFKSIIKKMSKLIAAEKIDKLVALDARGFIFASAIGYELGIGIVMARKPGKLPGRIVGCDYGLEYGSNKLEIQQDYICENDRVLIVDDVLATGGTADAASRLCGELKARVVGHLFFAEIDDLGGREVLRDNKINSLLHF